MEWISVKDRIPPPMEDVILCVNNENVMPGWNESVQPEEDPSYVSILCKTVEWPDEGIYVTHWMPLPVPPSQITKTKKNLAEEHFGPQPGNENFALYPKK